MRKWAGCPVGPTVRLRSSASWPPHWQRSRSGSWNTAYSAWQDLVTPRAQLVVCLDYPRLTSLRRLVVRSVRRALTREPVCNGNAESVRLLFSRESIVAWHFRSFAHKRKAMRALAAAPGTARVVLLRSPRHARAWLSGVASAAAEGRT